MNDIRITRGTDIALFADDSKLCGVTDFELEESFTMYEVNEFLSSKPFDCINKETKYNITLSTNSLFDYKMIDKKDFTLSLLDGDFIFTYEDCNLLRKTRVAKGSEVICDKYLITAKSMIQSEVENG